MNGRRNKKEDEKTLYNRSKRKEQQERNNLQTKQKRS